MDDILNILRKNAAMPVEKIALLVNQTSDEVEEKIKGWESDGTILGYTTVINTDKLEDESLVMAMIEVKITPEREGGFDKIARRIARFSEVKSCYLMSGGFDLLVMVEGEDLRQVAGFISERLATIQGVVSTATHFILKPYKQQGVTYVEEPKPERLKVTP
ncbi:MAG: Lrp/AsnC family transcriptional regulator [Limisphaerales bacterium]|jgi:DNA-binding Lrp family transcriptional regulator|nr:Lrp/AsnC family transcriptional regulator [Verrucomicrobiota bacterium]